MQNFIGLEIISRMTWNIVSSEAARGTSGLNQPPLSSPRQYSAQN